MTLYSAPFPSPFSAPGGARRYAGRRALQCPVRAGLATKCAGMSCRRPVPRNRRPIKYAIRQSAPKLRCRTTIFGLACHQNKEDFHGY